MNKKSPIKIKKISGTTSSTGVALGGVLVLEDRGADKITHLSREFDPEKELELFNKAVQASFQELEKLREEVRIKIGEDEEKIFEAQTNILEDPALLGEVVSRITEKNLTAIDAVRNTIVNLEQQFLNYEDRTVRQRIADIKDVGYRIMRELNREKLNQMQKLNRPVILVAKELIPSLAVQLDKDKIMAIITEKGGINSHASIIARSLDIPAVVGVKDLVKKVRGAETLIVDGFSGTIYLDPGAALIKKYEKIKAEREAQKPIHKVEPSKGSIKTVDGSRIYLFANVGRLSELNKLKQLDVAGVGLLRTEFLLMSKQSPPAQEDFISTFKTILDFMSPLPVNIRLLDLGADKSYPFITQPKEHNPALGNRGIRFLLSNPHLLKSQIRAILEASVAGNVRILLPMVTTVQEIREVIGILRRMEMEISKEGKNIKTQVPVGIMVETPSTAIMANKLAYEVDFFSIGTNDLTQYVLAADRDNEQVKDIYNSLNPSVLRLIKSCISDAKKADIEIAVCGEMASDLLSIPILLGMGVRHLSVSVNQIARVAEIVKVIDLKKAESLTKRVLGKVSVMEVEKMVVRYLKKMEKYLEYK